MKSKYKIHKTYSREDKRFVFVVYEDKKWISTLATLPEAEKLVDELIEADRFNEKYNTPEHKNPIITVEGKALFSGDEYWGVNSAFHLKHYDVTEYTKVFANLDSKLFLTMDNAKRWIKNNQKSISYAELEEFFEKTGTDYYNKNDMVIVNKLLNHFKPK